MKTFVKIFSRLTHASLVPLARYAEIAYAGKRKKNFFSWRNMQRYLYFMFYVCCASFISNLANSVIITVNNDSFLPTSIELF